MKKFYKFLTLSTLLLASFATPAADYTITKQNDIQTIETNWGGKWTGYIASIPGQLTKDSQTLSFDFSSPNYFKEKNTGHFAVGINGSGYTIEGKGVILGNVTAYPNKGDGCFGATVENAVVFESFWTTGNCVFGWSESVPLRNNIKYHLNITSYPETNVFSYDLYQYVRQNKYLISSHKTYDYSLSNAPIDANGWFIAEVFSTHDWTMYITNLKVE